MKRQDSKRAHGITVLRIFLAFALLMSFRIFQYFPGMQYVQEAWFVLCFLALVFAYPIVKIVRGSGVSSFEVYLLILIPVNILLPAWGAAREFKQPMLYGILAQRGAVLIAAVLLIVIAMRLRFISAGLIEATLLLLAWGTCGLYFLMNLFLDPSNFTSYRDFVSADFDTAKFVLRGEFLSFGLVYYALLALRRRRTKYYMLAAIFLIVIVSIADARAFLVSFVLVFLYFAYRWRPIGPFLLTIGKTCATTAVLLGMLYVVRPAYISDRVSAFADAFRVASFGSREVENASAQARVLEVITAWPYVLKNPLLGTGTISNQWNGGTRELVDFNFVPADIGLIGVIYAFGVIGMLIFAYQFRFAVKAARRLPDRLRSPLFNGCLGHVMLNAILSLSAPNFAFYPESTLFFIALLVSLSYERRVESSSELRLSESIQSASS